MARWWALRWPVALNLADDSKSFAGCRERRGHLPDADSFTGNFARVVIARFTSFTIPPMLLARADEVIE